MKRKIFEGFFGQLQTSHAINKNGLAVCLTRQPNNGTTSKNLLIDGGKWLLASYGFSTGSPVTYRNSTIYTRRNCTVMRHDNDRQTKLITQRTEQRQNISSGGGVEFAGWLVSK